MVKKIIHKKKDVKVKQSPLLWAFPLGILIVFVLFFIFLPKKNSLKVNNTSPAPILINAKTLPKGWSVSTDPLADNVKVKIEKNVTTGRKPTVVLIASTSDVENNKDYIDSLIAGARSALPSLVITKNEEKNINGYYMRDMTGYYYSGSEKVNIRQQIYKKNNNVFTLTASYDDVNVLSDDELNQVFNSLYTSYL